MPINCSVRRADGSLASDPPLSAVRADGPHSAESVPQHKRPRVQLLPTRVRAWATHNDHFDFSITREGRLPRCRARRAVIGWLLRVRRTLVCVLFAGSYRMVREQIVDLATVADGGVMVGDEADRFAQFCNLLRYSEAPPPPPPPPPGGGGVWNKERNTE